MIKWLQASFPWKPITTFPSGKEKTVQTGTSAPSEKAKSQYRQPNTYWLVYFWGPANASGVIWGIGQNRSKYWEREGDGDRYKNVQMQHRVSTRFFLYNGKNQWKSLSPLPFLPSQGWYLKCFKWRPLAGVNDTWCRCHLLASQRWREWVPNLSQMFAPWEDEPRSPPPRFWVALKWD